MWAWHIPWYKVKGNFIMKKNRNRQKKCPVLRPTFFIFGGDRREGDWKLKMERRRRRRSGWTKLERGCIIKKMLQAQRHGVKVGTPHILSQFNPTYSSRGLISARHHHSHLKIFLKIISLPSHS